MLNPVVPASSAPPLFCRGVPLCSAPRLAVVGSRVSRTGPPVAFAFAAHAARAGWVVGSGLASGCDVAAHRGCLAVEGRTFAVLPCGVDRVGPAPSHSLAQKIARAGCLISSYPDGTPPAKHRFIARNGVLVSLSQAVVVCAADITGGSMHTARFALEQNVPLACYLPARGPGSSGCRHLVESQGAKALSNPRELLAWLAGLQGARS